MTIKDNIAPATTPPVPAANAGFAKSVTPVTAQTIVRTDTQGLDAGPVTIPVGDFPMPAYCSRPKDGTGLPVILVISEIFGVHEHIADITRRFAKRGYLAIAPDLFVRQGDAKAYADMDALFAQVIDKVPDTQVLGDLDATTAWAGANGGDLSRLGVTGFCWGGRVTWLYAAHESRVRAGVAWYGKLKPPVTPLKPRRPIDVAGELHGPVLGLYGEQDQSIPMDTVAEMKAALAAGSPAARASGIVVYPQAGHAFNADYRPSYRQADAIDGWQRSLDWFAENGVRP
jgi:carboxymethylenebutenolidase